MAEHAVLQVVHAHHFADHICFSLAHLHLGGQGRVGLLQHFHQGRQRGRLLQVHQCLPSEVGRGGPGVAQRVHQEFDVLLARPVTQCLHRFFADLRGDVETGAPGQRERGFRATNLRQEFHQQPANRLVLALQQLHQCRDRLRGAPNVGAVAVEFSFQGLGVHAVVDNSRRPAGLDVSLGRFRKVGAQLSGKNFQGFGRLLAEMAVRPHA